MRAPLEYFGLAYSAWIALAVLFQFPRHLRYVQVQGAQRGLPALLGHIALPRFSARTFGVTGVVLVSALLAAAFWPAGRATALFAAAVATLFYFPQVIEIPEVRRKANTVPVILLLLAAALAASPDQPEEAARWCFLGIKLVLAQLYFSSGLAKLLNPGWRWADGATLRTKLVYYFLRYDRTMALALAARPLWCRVMATIVLGFELTFWLVIPFPELAWIYVPLGIAFHAGTAVLMRIHYWIYVVPAYFVFVRF